MIVKTKNKFPISFSGIVGLALLVSGCSEERSSPGVGSGEAKSEKTDEITVFTWSEYLDPETIERFESETGIRVNYEVFNTAGEMEGRLRSEPGAFDVVIVDDSIVTQLRELKFVRDIDRDKLPNLKNLAPKYKGMPFDPSFDFSVPYLWGTTLIAYRKDKVQNIEHSWNALFSRTNPIPVMLLDEPVQLYATLFSAVGEDPASIQPDLYTAATERVCDQIRNGDVALGGDEAVKSALIEGSVAAAMCYSTDAAMLADENEQIDYFLPSEGAPLWIDCFVVSRDAPNVEGAHRFIDFMLTAEAAAAATNYTWCATPNAAALPLVDPEILEDDRIFPPEEQIDRCFFLPALNSERQKLTNTGFFQIRSELREDGEQPGNESASAGAGH